MIYVINHIDITLNVGKSTEKHFYGFNVLLNFFWKRPKLGPFGPLGPNPLSGPQGPKQSSNKNLGPLSLLGPTWALWALPPVRIPE